MDKPAAEDVHEVRARFGHLPLYRVWPEWSSTGIWMPPAIGSKPVGPNLILDGFPISDALRDRLSRWLAMFEEQIPERLWEQAGSHAGFSGEGLNIAIDLSRELGEDAVIEYEIGDQYLLFFSGDCVATYPGPQVAKPTR